MVMNTYKYDNKSEAMQSHGDIGFDMTLLTKDMEVLGGKGEWKQFLGYKIFVDEGGMISKGPDPFIGQKLSDLEKLSFADGMTVGHSLRRAMGETNKSVSYEETYEDSVEKSTYMASIKDFIAQKVRENSVSRYASKDPLDAVLQAE